MIPGYNTKAEAEEYLDQVEFKIVQLKDNNIEDHSGDLMLEINSYIKKSRDYLRRRKYDMSYFMAKLAEEYIELIKARAKLEEAINDYNDAKGKNDK